MNNKAKIAAKLSAMDVVELSNVLCEMNRSLTTEAGLILSIGLDVMEAKMSEADFVRFCAQLEAA